MKKIILILCVLLFCITLVMGEDKEVFPCKWYCGDPVNCSSEQDDECRNWADIGIGGIILSCEGNCWKSSDPEEIKVCEKGDTVVNTGCEYDGGVACGGVVEKATCNTALGGGCNDGCEGDWQVEPDTVLKHCSNIPA